MKTTCALLGFVLVMLVVAHTPLVSADVQEGMSDAALDASLRTLSSPAWNDRAAAFYKILKAATPRGFRDGAKTVRAGLHTFLQAHSQKSDELKSALILLLENENAFARPSVTARLTEEFSAYWGDLAGTVAALEDQRAIPALVAIIDSGDLVTNGLAALGRAAVPAVVARIDDRDPVVRQSVARTLSKFLDPGVATAPMGPAAQETVKKALVRCTADPNEWVRVSALPGLARLPGSDITELLIRISETDPFVRPGRPGEPEQIYLVRQRAKLLLQNRKAGG